MENILVGLYTETLLHPGKGRAIKEAVDLPIQREKHTHFPIIQGSSVKGTFKHTAEQFGLDGEAKEYLFGPPPSEGQKGRGHLSIGEAKLLVFPVRSLHGVFGWVTCPIVLGRFKRDLQHVKGEVTWRVPSINNDTALTSTSTNLGVDDSVYLEDIKLDVTTFEDSNFGHKQLLQDIKVLLQPNDLEYIKKKLSKDLVILQNDVFKYLVRFATEISPRIVIDEDGTSQNLWRTEDLPRDTLLYSIVMHRGDKQDHFNKFKEKFDSKLIQIGANETTGKGFNRVKIVEGE